MIERGEGVWVWTEQGKKLIDGFAGLAVVNVGHGRREIAEAIAEQTVRLAYYPTTRQFSNRPAAELAAKLATLTPGDLDYTMFAVSGSEANERSMQIARHYWLATRQARQAQGHLAPGRLSRRDDGHVRGLRPARTSSQAYAPLEVPGFAKVAPPYPVPRSRRAAPTRSWSRAASRELREAIVREGPGHGVRGDPGAGALVGRLHHAADRLAPRGARDLRRARRADDRRRGHHRLRAHRPVVRRRARRASCPTSCRSPRASRRATCRCRPASRAAASPTPSPTTPRRRTCTPTRTRRIRWRARPRSRTSRSWSRTSWWRTRRRWARGCSTGSRTRGGQAPDRGRGARARPPGLRRLRGAGRLRQAARRHAGGRARPQGVGPRRHRLRARQRAAPGAAALHHRGRGGRAGRPSSPTASTRSSATWRRPASA